MRNILRVFALLATVALAACMGSLEPQTSGIDAPLGWTRLRSKAPPADTPLVVDESMQVEHDWWKHFGDPTLDALIKEALDNNKSLQIAKARVEEARADRMLARSSLFPQINAAASAQRGNQGFLTSDKTVNIGDAELDASWEIDLFGRNRAHAAEATAILESEEAGSQAVRIGLLAELARNYFDMRNYERQIALTRQNLETQKKTLDLTRVQLQGGYASDFDVQRAAAQVSTTDAEIPALEAAYDAALVRLNILLGLPPGSRDEVLKIEQGMKPLDQRVLIAAPATVLAERPDIRVAERRFAASISAKSAATAELFPDISLTAFFGAQSATGLSSTPWGVGLNLVQPILNFGRIESQIDAADARQKQAFLNYQQTMLEALENMEDALSQYLRETTRNASLTAAVTQNRNAEELARQQYGNGFTSLLDLLVAQRNLLDAEAGQAASDTNLRNDLVAIYTAAGGGWRD
ncbi:MAG TPA: efflux transporter outer membrane subunit [Micropepsaceae bacterium]|nr:efflux transporter outer membrane subunit [Micropepsaceae bacterium]